MRPDEREARHAVAPGVQLNNHEPYELARQKAYATPLGEDAYEHERVLYLWRLARAEACTRSYARAEEHIRKAIEIEPWLGPNHTNLSVFLGKQGKYDEAAEEARQAIERAYDSSSRMHAELVLACWEMLLGRREAAFKRMEEARKPEDDLFNLCLYHGCLACFHAYSGDEGRIAEHIRKALELDLDGQSFDFFSRDIAFDPYRGEDWFMRFVGRTLREPGRPRLKVGETGALAPTPWKGMRWWIELEHEAGVTSVAFSPKGHLLATVQAPSSAEGPNGAVIRIWNVDSGTCVHEFDSEGEDLDFVTFSPDGRYLVTAGKAACIWEIDTGRKMRGFRPEKGELDAVALSPDGETLALAGSWREGDSRAGECSLWSFRSGEKLKECVRYKGSVLPNAATFSPDGRLLALGCTVRHPAGPHSLPWASGGVVVIDARTGEESTRIPVERGERGAVAFSPDGALLAYGRGEEAVVLDMRTGNQVVTLRPTRGVIKDISFSANGRLLATASMYSCVDVWDARSGEHVKCLEGHRFDDWLLDSIDFSSDGKYLAAGTRAAMARVWLLGGAPGRSLDPARRTSVAPWIRPGTPLGGYRFEPDPYFVLGRRYVPTKQEGASPIAEEVRRRFGRHGTVEYAADSTVDDIVKFFGRCHLAVDVEPEVGNRKLGTSYKIEDMPMADHLYWLARVTAAKLVLRGDTLTLVDRKRPGDVEIRRGHMPEKEGWIDDLLRCLDNKSTLWVLDETPLQEIATSLSQYWHTSLIVASDIAQTKVTGKIGGRKRKKVLERILELADCDYEVTTGAVYIFAKGGGSQQKD